MPVLHATFDDRPAADRAVNELIVHGVHADQISLLMSEATKKKFGTSFEEPMARGGITGGAIGGGLAALAGGLIAATGGLAIPFLVAGPLAGVLMGGVSGVAVGTLVGALTGAGFATSDAADIESGVEKGAVVIAVEADDEGIRDVAAILRRDAVTEPSAAPLET